MSLCYSAYRTQTGGTEESDCRSICIRKKYDIGGDGGAESKKP